MGILRFVLAFAVIVGHTGNFWGIKMVPGPVAVQAFFIISGFYMSLILNEKYIGKNGSFRLFISNRFIRIYPIYWVILLLTLLLLLVKGLFLDPGRYGRLDLYTYTNFTSFIFLCFSNLFLFFQDVIMLLGINLQTGDLFFTKNFTLQSPALNTFLLVPQAWSLGIELLFYLIAPFILRRNPWFVFLVFLASLSLRSYLFNGLYLHGDPWSYRFFPTELAFFLLGYFSYKLSVKTKRISNKTLSTLIVILVVVWAFLYNYIPVKRYYFLPFELKDLCFFIFVFLSIPILFNYFKSKKWDSNIGELSYPMYISHMLLIWILTNLGFEGSYLSIFACGSSMILSILLVKYVSNPIEKYRQSRLS